VWPQSRDEHIGATLESRPLMPDFKRKKYRVLPKPRTSAGLTGKRK
jgi:hypothetical protein